VSTNGSNGDASAAVAVAVAEAVYEREALRPTERERLEEQRAANGGRRGNHSTTRVSIVIPALNEARNLRHVLANLPDGLFEVLLVPGSSTDDTVVVARTLQPDVRGIHQSRSGKGNAL